MEALILEYENKEDLNKALDILIRLDIKGVVAATLSAQDLQMIGKRKLVALKERIDAQPGNDEEDLSEENLKIIVNEVRQKMYEEGLHNHH